MTIAAPAPAGVSRLVRYALIGALGLALAGCIGAQPQATAGLPSGLTARLDTPGAQIDRTSALGIINQYRGTRGAGQLAPDAGLDQQAQALAAQYAQSGEPPRGAAGGQVVRLSAGYSTFADTFSGWRASPQDADAMARASARRAGLGAAFNPNSAYGVHWVLVLAD